MTAEKKRNIIIEILLAAVPLFFGYLLYLIFSPDVFISRIFYKAFSGLNLTVFADSKILFFLRCYACDFMWAFSLGITVHLFTEKKRKTAVLIIAAEIIFCFVLEFFQIWGIVPGTFDFVDLISETAAVLLAGFINYHYFAEGKK